MAHNQSQLKQYLDTITKKTLYISNWITQRGVNRYLFLAKNSPQYSSKKDAEAFIKEGLEKYPDNPDLRKYLAQLYAQSKQWKDSIQFWQAYFYYNQKSGFVSDYIELAMAFEKTRDFPSMEETILNGLDVYPDSRKLRDKYSHAAVCAGKWEEAITRYEEYIDLYPRRSYHALLKLSMIQQIMGHYEKADRLFSQALEKNQTELENDKYGYRQIRLFANGDTVIDFYKQLKKTNAIVTTFDTIDMTMSQPPFGFKILTKQSVDIIAVQKREVNTNQQDLSKENFNKAIQNVLNGYQDKVAYGASLGAYQALYYMSDWDCRILSLAPRILNHPQYGKKRFISQESFKHTLEIPVNTKLSPIIVYDPKNKMDHKYVTQEIKKSFPNGRYIEFPYGGHKITTHLSNLGALKTYLLTFIHHNRLPERNRKEKVNCPLYLRNLAGDCLRHGKLKWAENSVNRSLQIIPNDKVALNVKADLQTKQAAQNHEVDGV